MFLKINLIWMAVLLISVIAYVSAKSLPHTKSHNGRIKNAKLLPSPTMQANKQLVLIKKDQGRLLRRTETYHDDNNSNKNLQQASDTARPYLNNIEYDLRLRQLMEELVSNSRIENQHYAVHTLLPLELKDAYRQHLATQSSTAISEQFDWKHKSKITTNNKVENHQQDYKDNKYFVYPSLSNELILPKNPSAILAKDATDITKSQPFTSLTSPALPSSSSSTALSVDSSLPSTPLQDSLLDYVLLEYMIKTKQNLTTILNNNRIGGNDAAGFPNSQTIKQQLEFLQKNAEKIKKFQQVAQRTKNVSAVTDWDIIRNIDDLQRKALKEQLRMAGHEASDTELQQDVLKHNSTSNSTMENRIKTLSLSQQDNKAKNDDTLEELSLEKFNDNKELTPLESSDKMQIQNSSLIGDRVASDGNITMTKSGLNPKPTNDSLLVGAWNLKTQKHTKENLTLEIQQKTTALNVNATTLKGSVNQKSNQDTGASKTNSELEIISDEIVSPTMPDMNNTEEIMGITSEKITKDEESKKNLGLTDAGLSEDPETTEPTMTNSQHSGKSQMASISGESIETMDPLPENTMMEALLNDLPSATQSTRNSNGKEEHHYIMETSTESQHLIETSTLSSKTQQETTTQSSDNVLLKTPIMPIQAEVNSTVVQVLNLQNVLEAGRVQIENRLSTEIPISTTTNNPATTTDFLTERGEDETHRGEIQDSSEEMPIIEVFAKMPTTQPEYTEIQDACAENKTTLEYGLPKLEPTLGSDIGYHHTLNLSMNQAASNSTVTAKDEWTSLGSLESVTKGTLELTTTLPDAILGIPYSPIEDTTRENLDDEYVSEQPVDGITTVTEMEAELNASSARIEEATEKIKETQHPVSLNDTIYLALMSLRNQTGDNKIEETIRKTLLEHETTTESLESVEIISYPLYNRLGRPSTTRPITPMVTSDFSEHTVTTEIPISQTLLPYHSQIPQSSKITVTLLKPTASTTRISISDKPLTMWYNSYGEQPSITTEEKADKLTSNSNIKTKLGIIPTESVKNFFKVAGDDSASKRLVSGILASTELPVVVRTHLKDDFVELTSSSDTKDVTTELPSVTTRSNERTSSSVERPIQESISDKMITIEMPKKDATLTTTEKLSTTDSGSKLHHKQNYSTHQLSTATKLPIPRLHPTETVQSSNTQKCDDKFKIGEQIENSGKTNGLPHSNSKNSLEGIIPASSNPNTVMSNKLISVTGLPKMKFNFREVNETFSSDQKVTAVKQGQNKNSSHHSNVFIPESATLSSKISTTDNAHLLSSTTDIAYVPTKVSLTKIETSVELPISDTEIIVKPSQIRPNDVILDAIQVGLKNSTHFTDAIAKWSSDDLREEALKKLLILSETVTELPNNDDVVSESKLSQNADRYITELATDVTNVDTSTVMELPNITAFLGEEETTKEIPQFTPSLETAKTQEVEDLYAAWTTEANYLTEPTLKIETTKDPTRTEEKSIAELPLPLTLQDAPLLVHSSDGSVLHSTEYNKNIEDGLETPANVEPQNQSSLSMNLSNVQMSKLPPADTLVPLVEISISVHSLPEEQMSIQTAANVTDVLTFDPFSVEVMLPSVEINISQRNLTNNGTQTAFNSTSFGANNTESTCDESRKKMPESGHLQTDLFQTETLRQDHLPMTEVSTTTLSPDPSLLDEKISSAMSPFQAAASPELINEIPNDLKIYELFHPVIVSLMENRHNTTSLDGAIINTEINVLPSDVVELVKPIINPTNVEGVLQGTAVHKGNFIREPTKLNNTNSEMIPPHDVKQVHVDDEDDDEFIAQPNNTEHILGLHASVANQHVKQQSPSAVQANDNSNQNKPINEILWLLPPSVAHSGPVMLQNIAVPYENSLLAEPQWKFVEQLPNAAKLEIVKPQEAPERHMDELITIIGNSLQGASGLNTKSQHVASGVTRQCQDNNNKQQQHQQHQEQQHQKQQQQQQQHQQQPQQQYQQQRNKENAKEHDDNTAMLVNCSPVTEQTMQLKTLPSTPSRVTAADAAAATKLALRSTIEKELENVQMMAISKTIENQKDNQGKWTTTFENNQLNNDSLTKAGDNKDVEIPKITKQNANDHRPDQEDVVGNDTESDEGVAEMPIAPYKSSINDKDIKIQLHVAMAAKVNAKNKTQLEMETHEDGHILDSTNADNSTNRFKTYIAAEHRDASVKADKGLNEMSTIETKLLDISKDNQNDMTITGLEQAGPVNNSILNQVANNKDGKENDNDDNDDDDVVPPIGLKNGYGSKGNEHEMTSLKSQYESVTEYQGYKDVINESNNDYDKVNGKESEEDAIISANVEALDAVAEEFDHMPTLTDTFLNTQSFPGIAPYRPNLHYRRKAQRKQKLKHIQASVKAHPKKEITTTNWWHSLPYAEIREFLNAIINSVEDW